MGKDVGKSIKRLALIVFILGVIIAAVVSFLAIGKWIDEEDNFYLFLAFFLLVVLVFLSWLGMVFVYSWGAVVDNVQQMKSSITGVDESVDFPLLAEFVEKMKSKKHKKKNEKIEKKETTINEILGSLKNLYSLKLLTADEYDKAIDYFSLKKHYDEYALFNNGLLKLKEEFDNKKVSASYYDTRRKYLLSTINYQ